jgi:hypothetical protein
LGKFNYKRGLHRLYAVISVLWATTVLAVAVRDQPPANIETFSAFVAEQKGASGAKEDFWDRVARSTEGPTQKSFPLDPSDHTIRDFWLSRNTFAVLPPLAGYLALFVVAPWIARGFKKEG